MRDHKSSHRLLENQGKLRYSAAVMAFLVEARFFHDYIARSLCVNSHAFYVVKKMGPSRPW